MSFSNFRIVSTELILHQDFDLLRFLWILMYLLELKSMWKVIFCLWCPDLLKKKKKTTPSFFMSFLLFHSFKPYCNPLVHHKNSISTSIVFFFFLNILQEAYFNFVLTDHISFIFTLHYLCVSDCLSFCFFLSNTSPQLMQKLLPF